MMTTPTRAPDTPSTAFLNEWGFLGGVAAKGCARMRGGAGCVAPVQRNPSQYRRVAGFEGSGYQPGGVGVVTRASFQANWEFGIDRLNVSLRTTYPHAINYSVTTVQVFSSAEGEGLPFQRCAWKSGSFTLTSPATLLLSMK